MNAAIHYPDRSPRRTQQALAYLERAGLIAHVDTRRTPRRVWFLTDAGADAVITAGETRERPKVLTPKQAAGPLTAHTLGVNEVGISFLQAAGERGDEFLPLSWRHEVAHPLNRGRGRAPLVDRRCGLHLRPPRGSADRDLSALR
ncbi:MAG TPA: replication-relaxation family protein [Solirubrobacterales bacterium]|nr:replication-relaxation family protein [Solirubrobacterales bacterium]